jgi:thymidylate synthase (FAD)
MRTEILDHGYIELLESWGSDEFIVETARTSTAKGFLGWGPTEKDCNLCQGSGSFMGAAPDREDPKCSACKGTGKQPGDEKLLHFLRQQRHSTPFEFAGAAFEIQAPLAVFREWHRHRTQSYAEVSARYVPLPDVHYLPTTDRIIEGSKPTGNRQASSVGGVQCALEDALAWLAELADLYEHSERVYQSGLRRGVPKELARLSMTVGRYSKMRATTDLHNWLHFLGLRTAPGAMYEIRAYAHELQKMLAARFPRTMALYEELGR